MRPPCSSACPRISHKTTRRGYQWNWPTHCSVKTITCGTEICLWCLPIFRLVYLSPKWPETNHYLHRPNPFFLPKSLIRTNHRLNQGEALIRMPPGMTLAWNLCACNPTAFFIYPFHCQSSITRWLFFIYFRVLCFIWFTFLFTWLTRQAGYSCTWSAVRRSVWARPTQCPLQPRWRQVLPSRYNFSSFETTKISFTDWWRKLRMSTINDSAIVINMACFFNWIRIWRPTRRIDAGIGARFTPTWRPTTFCHVSDHGHGDEYGAFDGSSHSIQQLRSGWSHGFRFGFWSSESHGSSHPSPTAPWCPGRLVWHRPLKWLHLKAKQK